MAIKNSKSEKLAKIKARTKFALMLKEGNVVKCIRPDKHYAVADVKNGLLCSRIDKRMYSMARLLNAGYTFKLVIK